MLLRLTRQIMKRSGSRSDVQQIAEQLMIGEFSRQLGIELGQATIPIGKANVTVDGFHKEAHRVTLVEAWAHVGKAKPAQRHKVLSDMLKLALVTSVLRKSYPSLIVESYLVFADFTAAKVLSGRGWASLAAKEFGIATQVITLSDEVINTIKEAQRRQDIRADDECSAEPDVPELG
jgi:hypothetical protein